ncbi:hypothetical protein EGM70_10775 [Enterobacteriaceae bacterium 89]|nr:hypothetical protein [Enterobacteriaceae bacterium 89]
MDADIISYETLIATRDSADWVMYGAIAAWVAVACSVITFIFAAYTLTIWKKQEKLKLKSEFKRSLLSLDYSIHMMPDDWGVAVSNRIRSLDKSAYLPGDKEAAASFDDLKKNWHNAISAWVMCEGQRKEMNLTKKWEELSKIYVQYIRGLAGKETILKKLAEMHNVEFIFN